MFPTPVLVRLWCILLAVAVLAACSEAGSNTEDDLEPPAVATFTVGGTLTGLDEAEGPIELRLEHDFTELVLDDEGISRPTPTSEILALDATRNDQFYAFESELPAGTRYQVRIVAQPRAQGCEIDNRDGVVPDDDVVDIDVLCDDVVLAQPVLNDTGIDWCLDGVARRGLFDGDAPERQAGCDDADDDSLLNNDSALTYLPGQDGHVGRDAIARADTIDGTDNLGKQGAGEAGFDFIKISNSGDELAPAATLGDGPGDWACTQDAFTGLMWEVKVDDPAHLRHVGWTYSWFSSSLVNTGDSPGEADHGTCRDEGRCDIERFVQDVNEAGLCGFDDWRMPMREELRSIMHYGRPAPAIDPDYFPDLGRLMDDTFAASYWTRSPYAGDFDIAGDVGVPNAAWTIQSDGGGGIAQKILGLPVRLVRGGGE